jgi:uncharacterized phage infection (PIP) family protein YhgE
MTIQANEPSAEEIVRNFRGAHIFGITQALENRIADRLESQSEENESSRQLIEMQSNIITELTARAEQAERELIELEEKINDILKRGLPQEGEGV